MPFKFGLVFKKNMVYSLVHSTNPFAEKPGWVWAGPLNGNENYVTWDTEEDARANGDRLAVLGHYSPDLIHVVHITENGGQVFPYPL